MICKTKPENKENANLTLMEPFFSFDNALVRFGMQKNIDLGEKIMTVSHLEAKISLKAFFSFSGAFFYI